MASAPATPVGRAALILILLGLLVPAHAGPPNFGPERAAMVARLRRPRGGYPEIANPRVLRAMSRVPRHLFMEPRVRARAYGDDEIPLGSGQVMCSPYTVALAAQLLDPQPGMRILEVGTGSGYLAAVLAEITPHVYSIDMRPELSRQAQARLRSLHYGSVRCRVGKGCEGWAQYGPFDGIVVTCAARQVPEALIAQLKDGGRLVIPIGHGPEQTLSCMRKSGGKLHAAGVVMRLRVSPMVCQQSR
jgi:protein-L-isoaspartate(D-aspartate) O-methyltransferase